MSIKNEYKKQRKRIQNFIYRNKKRGFVFQVALPTIPKRITRGSVNRLKKLTPKYLYSKSIYVDSMNKQISGSKAAYLLRRNKSVSPTVNITKDAFNDYIIGNFIARFDYMPKEFRDTLTKAINEYLRQVGDKGALVQSLEQTETEFIPNMTRLSKNTGDYGAYEISKAILEFLPFNEQTKSELLEGWDENESWEVI